MTDKSNSTVKSYVVTLGGSVIDINKLPDYGCRFPEQPRGLSVQEQAKLIKSGQKQQR
ncbi:MAG: hypothetical protein WBP54_04300 [Pelodictyon phaeoclathratiforme]